MRMNLESGNLWSSGMNTKWADFLSVGLSFSSSLCSVVYLWIGTVLFMSAAFSNAMSLYVFITSLLLFAFTVFSSAFYAHSHPVSHLTPPPPPPACLSLALTPLSASAVLSCAVCLVLQGQDRAVLTGTSPEQCEIEGGRHRNWVKEGRAGKIYAYPSGLDKQLKTTGPFSFSL